MWRKQELLGRFQITPDKWSSYPHTDNKNQSLKFFLLYISHGIHILYLLWTLQWKHWTNFIHECQATPCRPASPVLAHPGDGGKEPILNNKDINGLVDGGVLPVWKKILEWHAIVWQKVVRAWQQSPLAPGRRGRLPVSGWLISYQGNKQRGMPLTSPLISSQGGGVLI